MTIQYKNKYNKVTEIKDFTRPSEEFLFKVNLPDSYDSYLDGIGEGVWAYTDKESYERIFKDEKEGIIYVKILNTSLYYDGLYYDTLIPVELRGKYRPVAIYEELVDKYGKSNW